MHYEKNGITLLLVFSTVGVHAQLATLGVESRGDNIVNTAASRMSPQRNIIESGFFG